MIRKKGKNITREGLEAEVAACHLKVAKLNSTMRAMQGHYSAQLRDCNNKYIALSKEFSEHMRKTSERDKATADAIGKYVDRREEGRAAGRWRGTPGSLRSHGRRGGKRKTRRIKHRGGAVSLEFEKPEVSNTSSSGAIQGAMHKQKAGNEETAKLNREFGQGGGGGDDVVVPQMNQAGESGNKTITGGVQQTLQGRADGEYDNDVNIKPQPDGMPGGGRRRRKTKKRRRKRKTKRRRKRKSKRKR